MTKKKKQTEPRILIWDIETSFMKVATFSLYPNYIPHDAILEDWTLLGGAYKWLGEKEIYSTYQAKEIDRVKELRKVVEEADIIIAHNNDKFDLKMLNARILKYGLPPLPKKITIDTLKVAKNEFRLSSNKLDYLGKYLGVGAKIRTGGNELWLDVLAGSKKALKFMERYNKQDVRLLEKVYLKLRPYIKNHPNLNLWSDNRVCTNCGSESLVKHGLYMTRVSKYQRYKCNSCGSTCIGGLRVSPTTEIR